MTNWFQSHHINPIYGWGMSKRWIVHGGPQIDADCRLQNAELIQQARESGCVYVEIRCYDDYSAYREQLEEAGFVYEPHYDVTIDPQKPVPDAKMRQIRRAVDEGYQWRETSHHRDVRRWYRKLRRLYWYKIHRPLPRFKWFKDMIYNNGCRLLIVERSISDSVQSAQRSIVGGVMLAVEEDKSKAYEWYICGQVMSTWAAIEYCRQHGIHCFDTMGAGIPDVPYGVRDFKLQMGGELHEWGRYICVLRPMWYKFGKWIIKLVA